MKIINTRTMPELQITNHKLQITLLSFAVAIIFSSCGNKKAAEHSEHNDSAHVEEAEIKLTDEQIKAIGKWSDEKIKETYIKINGEYRNCEFTNNWVKK